MRGAIRRRVRLHSMDPTDAKSHEKAAGFADGSGYYSKEHLEAIRMVFKNKRPPSKTPCVSDGNATKGVRVYSLTANRATYDPASLIEVLLFSRRW